MIYINNSAMSFPKPAKVLESIYQVLLSMPYDPGRGLGMGGGILTKCRQNLARLINAGGCQINNKMEFLVQLCNKKSDGTVWSSFTGSSGGTGANHISYDAAGNRTEFIAGTLYAGTTDYTYDSKNELTQDSSTRNGNYSYSNVYDSAGNPTTFRGTASLTYNSNNQRSNTGYTFDNNGNPTTYNSTTLTFDEENRMTAYGTALTAGYRGDGLRAWRQTGASNTRVYYLYDGLMPVCELDSTGALTKINLFGANGLLERRDVPGSTDVFYQFDPQGSVVHRLDGSQTVLTSHLYDAWGNLLSAAANPDPYGYVGQAGYYTDTATGLILCTYRYYDPVNGRFLTRDPIGFDGGINLYAYVFNNSINFIDPKGLLEIVKVSRPSFHWYFRFNHSKCNGYKNIGYGCLGCSFPSISGPGEIRTDDDAHFSKEKLNGRNISTIGYYIGGPDLESRVCGCIYKFMWDFPSYNLITNNCQQFVKKMLCCAGFKGSY